MALAAAADAARQDMPNLFSLKAQINLKRFPASRHVPMRQNAEQRTSSAVYFQLELLAGQFFKKLTQIFYRYRGVDSPRIKNCVS